MESIKTMIHIVGVSCAGKSYYAEILAKKLGLYCVHLDATQESPIPGYFDNMIDRYRNVLSTASNHANLFLAEGQMPFSSYKESICYMAATEGYRIIYVVIKPSFEQYEKNIEERDKINSIFYTFNKEQYEDTYNEMYRKIGKKFILIESDEDIDKITKQDVLNLTYQHIGVTDIRWKQLSVPCKNKSILDIGCCSGYYGIFSKKDGASKYTGLDSEGIHKYLDNNIHEFNANNLELWDDKSDIVISTSMFHYISDKEKFIKECSRLSNEMFILESPVSLKDGNQIELIESALYKGCQIPTKGMIEFWLDKYFSSFECLGEGISQNGSTRYIWRCKK